MPTAKSRLVRLPNGTYAVHALAYGEQMHLGLGPVAEAESLYVGQFRIRKRVQQHAGEFVVWDVGLGAAANALAVLRATREYPNPVRLLSFDDADEPLAFALYDARGHRSGAPTPLVFLKLSKATASVADFSLSVLSVKLASHGLWRVDRTVVVNVGRIVTL